MGDVIVAGVSTALLATSAAVGEELDLAQFGPFAVAVVIAWALIVRYDKRLDHTVAAEKAEHREELAATNARLEQEMAAHAETRAQLYAALRDCAPPSDEQ